MVGQNVQDKEHFGTIHNTRHELQSQCHVERAFPLLVKCGNLCVHAFQRLSLSVRKRLAQRFT